MKKVFVMNEKGEPMSYSGDNRGQCYDPVVLVKDLADKIGIDRLYEIARDIRGKGEDVDHGDLIRQNEEMKLHIQGLKEDMAMMRGEINGLRFAIRCNGVSGSGVSLP